MHVKRRTLRWAPVLKVGWSQRWVAEKEGGFRPLRLSCACERKARPGHVMGMFCIKFRVADATRMVAFSITLKETMHTRVKSASEMHACIVFVHRPPAISAQGTVAWAGLVMTARGMWLCSRKLRRCEPVPGVRCRLLVGKSGFLLRRQAPTLSRSSDGPGNPVWLRRSSTGNHPPEVTEAQSAAHFQVFHPHLTLCFASARAQRWSNVGSVRRSYARARALRVPWLRVELVQL
nr:hypothetical protein CFP56_55001 [Quercus suber]